MRSLSSTGILQPLPSILNTSASPASVLRIHSPNLLSCPVSMVGQVRFYHQVQQQGMCSILELEEHRVFKKELDKKELMDIMVKHILDADIYVQKVALNCNVSIFRKPGNLTVIGRNTLPKDLDVSIKVGKFTVADDEVIQQNWDSLIIRTGISEEEAKEELFNHEKKDKVIGLKSNIVGYFLAQGLPDIRLATEVIQRARIILCARKGKFTAEEDTTILQFVEKEGKKWSELARLMARTEPNVVKRRYEVLTGGNTVSGHYTMKEDKIILREVFAVNRNILEDDGTVTEEDWRMIGGKLERYYASVYGHWNRVLKPMLLRHHAGTAHVDIREALINYLVEKNMKYAQDVDWEEVAKLPEFAGTTRAYLRMIYRDMQANTGRKYRMSKVELTTEAVQSFMEERETSTLDSYNERQREKTEEYRRELISFYLSNIVGKSNE